MVARRSRSLTTAWFGALVIGWLAVLVAVPFLTARTDDHPYGVVDTVPTLTVVSIIPALLALALVAGAITALGWWEEVVVERLGAPRWMWWYGAVLAGASVLAIDWSLLTDLGAAFALLALLTCLTFAAGAELLFRGVTICWLRRSGMAEPTVATRSSVIFAVAVAGSFLVEGPLSLGALIVLAALGFPLYLLRRVGGSIAVPIAAHALALFGLSSGGWDDGGRTLPTTLALLLLLGLAAVAIALRGRVTDLVPVPAAARRPARAAVRWIGGTLAVVLAVAVLAMVVPVSSGNLDAHPDPTADYDDAVAAFTEATADEEELGVFESCRSVLMDHGESTDVSIVLFHGLTNCPEQFLDLGRQLYDDGANVLIMRAPHHGLADRSGQAIGDVGLVGSLTAQELRDYADESVDIAEGLGEEVRVLGLSMGGVVSMWTAQFRDVDRVVAVAPAVSIPGVPHFVTTGFVNLFNRLPNISLPTSGIELDHTYAGESTGALASMFLLARANENELTTNRSSADDVVVVLNPDDDQVDFDHVRELVAGWDDADGPVEVVDLPAIGLPHDVIDPAQPEGDVELVYPILVDLLEGGG